MPPCMRLVHQLVQFVGCTESWLDRVRIAIVVQVRVARDDRMVRMVARELARITRVHRRLRVVRVQKRRADPQRIDSPSTRRYPSSIFSMIPRKSPPCHWLRTSVTFRQRPLAVVDVVARIAIAESIRSSPGTESRPSKRNPHSGSRFRSRKGTKSGRTGWPLPSTNRSR